MARRRTVGGVGDAPPTDLPPDPETETEIDADPESVARTICLRLLTARSRTRTELADALKARNVPDEAAEIVLSRFTEVGLIDDAAFASTFAASRHAERGFSAREISRQLRDKGVDDSLVRDAVSSIDRSSEQAAATRLAAKKVPSMRGLDAATQTRRLVAMLARKGYGPGVAHAAVRQVLAEESVPALPDIDECG